MKCPDCKHPIEEHGDFFCMHVKCDCNQGKATVLAKAERDAYKRKYNLAVEGLKNARIYSGSHPELTGVINRAFKNIEEIDA